MSILPDSSRRRARSPRFLTRRPGKAEHPLFGGTDGDAELLFASVDGDPDGAASAGVEALAPPLPPPATQMMSDAAERLGRAIAELRLTSERLGAETAATAIEIGCLVARRILEAELKTDIEAHRSLVRSAVRRLGEEHRVTVHLAPTDLELVRAAAGGSDDAGGDLGLSLGIAKVEIFPDTNLTPGDCLVESDAAMVDGRIGTRLEEIRRVLTNVMTAHGSDTP
jgi:flagellar biosynthesis/type III secretory pathway protein FliH